MLDNLNPEEGNETAEDSPAVPPQPDDEETYGGTSEDRPPEVISENPPDKPDDGITEDDPNLDKDKVKPVTPPEPTPPKPPEPVNPPQPVTTQPQGDSVFKWALLIVVTAFVLLVIIIGMSSANKSGGRTGYVTNGRTGSYAEMQPAIEDDEVVDSDEIVDYNDEGNSKSDEGGKVDDKEKGKTASATKPLLEVVADASGLKTDKSSGKKTLSEKLNEANGL